MSYILEALKKSEQERERGAVPDIKTVHNTDKPAGTASKNNWWWFLLAIVILVNGGIFAIVYLGEDMTGQQGQVADGDIASTIIDGKSQQQAALPNGDAKTVEPTDSISTNDTVDKIQKSKSTVLNEEKQIPRVVVSKEPLQLDDSVGNVGEPSNTQKQTSNEPSMEAPVQEESAMLVSELPDNVRKQIPSIAFEGHVYSSTVERRSVMINGKKMRQGDAVSADLMLKEITPLGAEFEYQGYRFKLNALQDWSYQ
jgi:general secretion pathway protein B